MFRLHCSSHFAELDLLIVGYHIFFTLEGNLFAAEVQGAFWIGLKAPNAATAVGAQGIGADRIGATW